MKRTEKEAIVRKYAIELASLSESYSLSASKVTKLSESDLDRMVDIAKRTNMLHEAIESQSY